MIISEYYVPTMYIFMIYALIFIAGVSEARIKNVAIWSLYYDLRTL